MRTSGPLARWGYCTTQLDRIHHKATDRVTPTCLMLTTHWRMPPRLSRGLAHVSRGHSITLRCRSPPGRCLSSAPSVSHRLTGGAQHHARKSASSPHFTRKPCMLAQRVHSTAWLNMSPALHASLRVGWPPRCTTRGMAWRLTGDSAEFPCLASRAAGHAHLGRLTERVASRARGRVDPSRATCGRTLPTAVHPSTWCAHRRQFASHTSRIGRAGRPGTASSVEAEEEDAGQVS